MWVGKPIAKALHIDINEKAGRAKVRSLLDTWTKNGVFVVFSGKTDDRHKTRSVEVGKWATD
jgi:hypothetical protein